MRPLKKNILSKVEGKISIFCAGSLVRTQLVNKEDERTLCGDEEEEEEVWLFGTIVHVVFLFH